MSRCNRTLPKTSPEPILGVPRWAIHRYSFARWAPPQFSIANTPDPEAGITLHIRRVPNGRFTGHVFDGLRERDLLRFQGPFGTFFLDEKSERPAVLMAGGTGLAPIKAILQSAFEQKDERPFHLFWGSFTTGPLSAQPTTGLVRETPQPNLHSGFI